MNIRQPAVAGTFYPGSKKELELLIDNLIKNSKDFEIKGKLKGLIVPHAGYEFSGIVAASGYKLLKKCYKKISKIILIGPSHQVYFEGASISNFDFWETPLGKIKSENLSKYIKNKILVDVPKAHLYEHSLEVQLPFLQYLYNNEFTIYPLVLSDVDPKNLAYELLKFIKSEDIIIIVSSDLSHYHQFSLAVQIDSIANTAIPNLDIKKVQEEVEACGKQGILTLLYIASTLNLKGVLVDYKNSGHITGDISQVVGYGCYVFM